MEFFGELPKMDKLLAEVDFPHEFPQESGEQPWEADAVVVEEKPRTFLAALHAHWPKAQNVAFVAGMLLLLLFSDFSPVSLHSPQHLRAPEPTRSCGILWFYDVPGSGGPFLDYLQHLRKSGEVEDVVSLRRSKDFPALARRLAAVATSPPPGILVVHHDRGPGLMQVGETLDGYDDALRAGGCRLFRVVLLRDPEDLVASQLQLGLRNKKQVELALQLDNPQLRFLLNNHADRMEAFPTPDGVNATALTAALKVLRTMDVVGFMDEYDTFAETVAALVGWEPPAPLGAQPAAAVPTSLQETVVAQTLWDAQLVTRARAELR